jgi:hypothetical protein
MASSKPQTIALALARGKNINAADVISLLQEIYSEGIGTTDEARELIDFDRSLSSATPGWREFFAATVCDHLINRSAPIGELDEQKAEWLIHSLSHGGRIVTAAGFAALVRAIETARDSSSRLIAYAIEQLRVAVIAGEGPAIGARAHFSRMIDRHDVALLRRLLIAGGGVEGRPVTHIEAEALFDLHDVVAPDANDAGFEDLFFKAVASHLIGDAGKPRRELLLPDPRLAELSEATRIADEADYSLPAGVAAVRLGTDEAAWLASRIMRDGRPTGAEFALLRLFSDATARVEPTLRHYLDHAA